MYSVKLIFFLFCCFTSSFADEDFLGCGGYEESRNPLLIVCFQRVAYLCHYERYEVRNQQKKLNCGSLLLVLYAVSHRLYSSYSCSRFTCILVRILNSQPVI